MAKKKKGHFEARPIGSPPPEKVKSDYTASEDRRHHQFYISSGDLVIQVEEVIFKVHRHFLTTQSEVFSDMIAVSRVESSTDGTDSRPLILSGDQVDSWELFLSAIYRSNLLAPVKYTGKEKTAVLRIAHKYCMQVMEEELISGLKEGNDTAGFLDLMVASQIVDSADLYEMALKGLIASEPKPTLEEAKSIGIEAYHAVMSQSIPRKHGNCPQCQATSPLSTYCGNCGHYY